MKKGLISIVCAFLLLGTLFTSGLVFGNEEGFKVTPEKIEDVLETTGTLSVSGVEDRTLTFNSSDSQVVTVDENGQWKITGVGIAEIKVTCEGEEPISVPVTGKEEESLSLMAAPDDVVPDIALKAAVNNELGRPITTPISIADMESLTNLHIYGESDYNSTEPRVASLEGLQYAINLTNLYIPYGDLRSDDVLAPISGLTNLKYLSIDSSYLTSENLQYLGALTNLEYFNANYNNLTSFQGMEPLFEGLLERWAIDPTLLFYTGFYGNPIYDFTAAGDYYTFLYNYNMNWTSTPEEAKFYSVQEIMRSSGRNLYEFAYQLSPDWQPAIWGQEAVPITLPAIWAIRPTEDASPEKNRVPVKEGVIDAFGDKVLFFGDYDWHQDIGSGNVDFMQYIGNYEWLEYMNALTNGYGSANPTDTIEDYITLKTRDSFDHPGETEYYYEGRDFNIVPYNPNATGPSDRQAVVSAINGASTYDITVYYVEFKNFENPVLKDDGSGFYYPNPYKNSGDTTTVLFPGRYYLPEVNFFIDTSFYFVTYSQLINWINPESPYFEGVSNETITTGSAFDPMTGISAYDPTMDGDNPDGSNPKNITSSIRLISGFVDVNTPGTYTLVYEVTSPYGLTTTIERQVTVVAGSTPDNGGSSSGGKKIVVPKTGGDLLAPVIIGLGSLVTLSGLKKKK